jgi:hypothetical protein
LVFQQLGRSLILVGALLIVAGLLITYGGRLPFRLGRLPGDIVWEGKHGAFYFPLATGLILSVLFSFVLWLFSRR